MKKGGKGREKEESSGADDANPIESTFSDERASPLDTHVLQGGLGQLRVRSEGRRTHRPKVLGSISRSESKRPPGPNRIPSSRGTPKGSAQRGYRPSVVMKPRRGQRSSRGDEGEQEDDETSRGVRMRGTGKEAAFHDGGVRDGRESGSAPGSTRTGAAKSSVAPPREARFEPVGGVLGHAASVSASVRVDEGPEANKVDALQRDMKAMTLDGEKACGEDNVSVSRAGYSGREETRQGVEEEVKERRRALAKAQLWVQGRQLHYEKIAAAVLEPPSGVDPLLMGEILEDAKEALKNAKARLQREEEEYRRLVKEARQREEETRRREKEEARRRALENAQLWLEGRQLHYEKMISDPPSWIDPLLMGKILEDAKEALKNAEARLQREEEEYRRRVKEPCRLVKEARRPEGDARRAGQGEVELMAERLLADIRLQRAQRSAMERGSLTRDPLPLSHARGSCELFQLMFTPLEGTSEEFESAMGAISRSTDRANRIVVVAHVTGAGKTKQQYSYGRKVRGVVEVRAFGTMSLTPPWVKLVEKIRNLKEDKLERAVTEITALICEYTKWVLDVLELVAQMLGDDEETLSEEEKRYILLMSVRNGPSDIGISSRYKVGHCHAMQESVETLGERWQTMFRDKTRPVIALDEANALCNVLPQKFQDSTGKMHSLYYPALTALVNLVETNDWRATACGTLLEIEQAPNIASLRHAIKTVTPHVHVTAGDMLDSLRRHLVFEDVDETRLEERLTIFEGRPVQFFDFVWGAVWRMIQPEYSSSEMTTAPTITGESLFGAINEAEQTLLEAWDNKIRSYLSDTAQVGDLVSSPRDLVWHAYSADILYGGAVEIANDRDTVATVIRSGIIVIDRRTHTANNVRNEPLVLTALRRVCEEYLDRHPDKDPVTDHLLRTNQPRAPRGSASERGDLLEELVAWRLVHACRQQQRWRRREPMTLETALTTTAVAGAIPCIASKLTVDARHVVDAKQGGFDQLLDEDDRPQTEIVLINLADNAGADVAFWGVASEDWGRECDHFCGQTEDGEDVEKEMETEVDDVKEQTACASTVGKRTMGLRSGEPVLILVQCKSRKKANLRESLPSVALPGQFKKDRAPNSSDLAGAEGFEAFLARAGCSRSSPHVRVVFSATGYQPKAVEQVRAHNSEFPTEPVLLCQMTGDFVARSAHAREVAPRESELASALSDEYLHLLRPWGKTSQSKEAEARTATSSIPKK